MASTANPPWGLLQRNTQLVQDCASFQSSLYPKTDHTGVLVLACPASLRHGVLHVQSCFSSSLPQVFIMRTSLLNEMLYESLSLRTRSQASYQFLQLCQAASCMSPGKKRSVSPVTITRINKPVPKCSGRFLTNLAWKTPGKTYFHSTSGNFKAAESHLSGNPTMMLLFKSKERPQLHRMWQIARCLIFEGQVHCWEHLYIIDKPNPKYQG
ncbi:uncharacterized protein LOC123384361 [Felis catus]|uniref:uncharacterized protein LOC123384361 n=1 Tax=Felis catus TaxID=9685 RepID=UPI001D19DD87|nr:uncharacterized protein LOC123384361 [Felis catus]